MNVDLRIAVRLNYIYQITEDGLIMWSERKSRDVLGFFFFFADNKHDFNADLDNFYLDMPGITLLYGLTDVSAVSFNHTGRQPLKISTVRISEWTQNGHFSWTIRSPDLSTLINDSHNFDTADRHNVHEQSLTGTQQYTYQ